MTKPGPKKNVAASVRDRLMRLAHARNENFNFVLERYAMERLLYRLSRSDHEPTFVLKGAMLFTVWSGHPHRATRDIDLLGTGPPDLQRVSDIFRSICDVPVENDGIVFDPASVKATRIKQDANYEGVRVELRAKLGTAMVGLQVDVGFGDAVTPAATTAEFPVLLGSPAPTLRIYPRETVIAEKFEAMVQLGIANSRMKDFFDIRFLARSFSFQGHQLVGALDATFRRRKTPIPSDDPVALGPFFSEDPHKEAQWKGFLKRSGVSDTGLTLVVVVADIRSFLNEPLEALRRGATFTKTWSDGTWK